MTSGNGIEPGLSTPQKPEAVGTIHVLAAPDLRDRAAASIRDLLRQRNGRTICPSEAARAIGGNDWRDLMPLVRDMVEDPSESLARVFDHCRRAGPYQ